MADLVLCVDAEDTFNNLKTGKEYPVIRRAHGFVFVRGEAGFLGGWDAQRFVPAPPHPVESET